MIVHDVEQGTPEWLRLRLGIPTSSEFGRILTPTGKPSSQAEGYLLWLLAEWVTGAPLESPETDWMRRGHELEAAAVQSYEFETGREASVVGFVTTDDGMIGASPDRLVDPDGLLEIKCPAPQTHIGYLLSRAVDRAYWPQVQGQLLVTGRAWVDIQSYHPGLPAVIVRVERDENYIGKLDAALRAFVERLLAARVELEAKCGPFRKPEPKPHPSPFDLTDEDVEVIVRNANIGGINA